MKPLTACYYLFNKIYTYAAPADAEAPRPEPKTPFVCLKSNEHFGPDGGEIGEDCCLRGRACFRPETEVEV